MMQARRTYEEVLAAAQAQGYAERDPSADVEGHDAANKLAILTRLAFGAWPEIGSIVASPPSLRGDGKPGITGVSAADIAGAVGLSLAIRLVATASTPGTAEPAFGLAGSVMTSRRPGRRAAGTHRRRPQPPRGRRRPGRSRLVRRPRRRRPRHQQRRPGRPARGRPQRPLAPGPTCRPQPPSS